MENKIQIGDAVRLKGQPNGPDMTVVQEKTIFVEQLSADGQNKLGQKPHTTLDCGWFDSKGHYQMLKFHPSALEKVKDPRKHPLTPDECLPPTSEPDRKPTVGCGHEAPKAYTLSDMEKCFNESRLTNPMIGFKHDSFETYLSFQRKSNIPPVPDLGTEHGYFHWFTTGELGGIKPLHSIHATKEDLLNLMAHWDSNVHSIFLASEKTAPPKTWDEVWASITDIYNRKDGTWVRRPLPAEKKSEDEWHYIKSLYELRDITENVWTWETAAEDWRRNRYFQGWWNAKTEESDEAASNKHVPPCPDGSPSTIRIKKSDLK